MKGFKNLPSWVQVGLTAGTFYLLIKTFKKDHQQENQRAVQRAGAIYDLTFTPERFKQIADEIYNLVKYGIGENKKVFIDTLNKFNTNADLNQIITEYGSRTNYLYGEPTGLKDLVTNIKTILTPGEIDTLNSNWSKKNITYKV